jgi:nitroreductase
MQAVETRVGRVNTQGIEELLARRSSPRAFSSQPVEKEKLSLLFEAARWAPSSYNEQPWRFLVATRENEGQFDRILDTLVEGNRVWARHAPVLILAVAKRDFSHSGRPNRHALYDTGQAVANLTVEATALGLHVHQMAGFGPEMARRVFRIPEGYEAVTAIAVGYRGDPEDLPEPLRSREVAPRTRKPLAEFVFSGSWGKPSPLVAGEGTAEEVI